MEYIETAHHPMGAGWYAVELVDGNGDLSFHMFTPAEWSWFIRGGDVAGWDIPAHDQADWRGRSGMARLLDPEGYARDHLRATAAFMQAVDERRAVA